MHLFWNTARVAAGSKHNAFSPGILALGRTAGELTEPHFGFFCASSVQCWCLKASVLARLGNFPRLARCITLNQQVALHALKHYIRWSSLQQRQPGYAKLGRHCILKKETIQFHFVAQNRNCVCAHLLVPWGVKVGSASPSPGSTSLLPANFMQ